MTAHGPAIDGVIARQTALDPARFDLTVDGPRMMAVVTTGHGGYDKLEYRAVPRPAPAAGEVLLQVLAAGVNTTDINARLGWYSAAVDGSTETLAAAPDVPATRVQDGGWNAPTPFPFIQGTDCCGQGGRGGARRRPGPARSSRPRAPLHAPEGLRLDGDGLDGV